MDCTYFETVLNDFVTKHVDAKYFSLSLVQGIVIED